MPFDKTAFLEELFKAGTFSDDQKKAWETALGVEAAQTYLESATLRQSDYSRLMNETNTLKKDYNQKISETIALQAEVTKDKEKYGKADPATVAELKSARDALAAMETKIMSAYQKSRSEYGQAETEKFFADIGLGAKPEDIIVKVPPTKVEDKTPAADTNYDDRYLRTDAAQQLVEFMAFDYPILTNEYRSLAGKDFDYADFRAKVKADGGKHSPLQIMQDEYKFDDLRKDREQKRIDALIEQARMEAYQKGRTESLLNTGSDGAPKPTPFIQGMLDDHKKFAESGGPAPVASTDTRNAAIQDLEKRIQQRPAA